MVWSTQDASVTELNTLRSGVRKFTDTGIAIIPTSGLQLHLNAFVGLQSTGGIVSQWNDQSINANHAISTNTIVNTETIAVNGQSVDIVQMPEDTAQLEFNLISTIRQVFWVMYRPSAGGGYFFLLGGANVYHFHGNRNTLLNSRWANSGLKNGTWKLNNVGINPTITGIPTTRSIISATSTNNLTASRIGRDRTYGGAKYGRFCEIIIYDRILSAKEEEEVYETLTNRWGLN